MGWLRLFGDEDEGEDDEVGWVDDDQVGMWNGHEFDHRPSLSCLGSRLVFNAIGQPEYVPVIVDFSQGRCMFEGKVELGSRDSPVLSSSDGRRGMHARSCDENEKQSVSGEKVVFIVNHLGRQVLPEQGNVAVGKPIVRRCTHEISSLEKGKQVLRSEVSFSHEPVERGSRLGVEVGMMDSCKEGGDASRRRGPPEDGGEIAATQGWVPAMVEPRSHQDLICIPVMDSDRVQTLVEPCSQVGRKSAHGLVELRSHRGDAELVPPRGESRRWTNGRSAPSGRTVGQMGDVRPRTAGPRQRVVGHWLVRLDGRQSAQTEGGMPLVEVHASYVDVEAGDRGSNVEGMLLGKKRESTSGDQNLATRGDITVVKVLMLKPRPDEVFTMAKVAHVEANAGLGPDPGKGVVGVGEMGPSSMVGVGLGSVAAFSGPDPVLDINQIGRGVEKCSLGLGFVDLMLAIMGPKDTDMVGKDPLAGNAEPFEKMAKLNSGGLGEDRLFLCDMDQVREKKYNWAGCDMG